MLLWIILFGCLLRTQASEECIVGEWGPMSDWFSPSCRHEATASGPKIGDSDHHGEFNRYEIMQMKLDEAAKTAACRRDGSCPERVSKTRPRENCVNGLAGIYECHNVDMLSVTSFDDLCGVDCGVPVPDVVGADIWGWYDENTGDEYAMMNMNVGTSFVRVTDPENPVVVAFMPGTLGANDGNTARDIKVINNHAFVGSEWDTHGIQIFDLTWLSSMSGPLVVVQPDSTYPAIGNSHNLVTSASSNTLFVVGATHNGSDLCLGGPFALDVSDPKNPVKTGCFGGDAYTHDAQCVVYNGPDSRYLNKEICFNYNEDDILIADVTNKNNVKAISKVDYAGNEYTHQGWLTEDHAMLIMEDELDEYYSYNGTQEQRTHLWDITDLEQPILETTYWSGRDSVDHNLYTLGDYVYQSNYQTGLRILRISQNPARLQEVAYFDVYPGVNEAQFNGMWSSYIYLPSGNIVSSSIEGGLFVLRPNMTAVEEEYSQGLTYRERSQTRPIIRAYDIDDCPVTKIVQQELVRRECEEK